MRKKSHDSRVTWHGSIQNSHIDCMVEATVLASNLNSNVPVEDPTHQQVSQTLLLTCSPKVASLIFFLSQTFYFSSTLFKCPSYFSLDWLLTCTLQGIQLLRSHLCKNFKTQLLLCLSVLATTRHLEPLFLSFYLQKGSKTHMLQYQGHRIISFVLQNWSWDKS